MNKRNLILPISEVRPERKFQGSTIDEYFKTYLDMEKGGKTIFIQFDYENPSQESQPGKIIIHRKINTLSDFMSTVREDILFNALDPRSIKICFHSKYIDVLEMYYELFEESILFKHTFVPWHFFESDIDVLSHFKTDERALAKMK